MPAVHSGRALKQCGLMENEPVQPARRHIWPWFLVAALLLGAVLTFLWVSAEVRRTKDRRQYYIPSTESNAAAPARP